MAGGSAELPAAVAAGQAACLVSCTKGMRRLAGSGAGALLAFAAAGSWRSRCLNVRDVSEHAECDVLVVGGGVCGMSVAWHLAKSGQRVIVLERDAVGSASQASSVNCGLDCVVHGRAIQRHPLQDVPLHDISNPAIWVN